MTGSNAVMVNVTNMLQPVFMYNADKEEIRALAQGRWFLPPTIKG